jgi:hypothetical protein
MRPLKRLNVRGIRTCGLTSISTFFVVWMYTCVHKLKVRDDTMPQLSASTKIDGAGRLETAELQQADELLHCVLVLVQAFCFSII